ncbi:SHOCT domain-containing protein [Oxalobacteraceae bacterium R-40]|uniref:SHOCT domain-containing protein n=1 Tax=Keguizhuia sedimenti TaxID=3064264 RepID=A0ABU1BRF6_9BURK|nr:SHOCT domain-containing protein [Oxalobacteraceae bacterium R-40]
MMGWHWDGGWTLFGMLHMLVWWIFAILVIAFLAKLVFSNRNSESQEDRALSILRERYARGEIDKEEFDARKRDLAK